jgi:hypothetical protein
VSLEKEMTYPYALPRRVVLEYTPVTKSVKPSKIQFKKGTYSCPWNSRDVWTILTCGQYESFMIWLVSWSGMLAVVLVIPCQSLTWKVAVMIAWEATIAAKIARIRLG